MPRRWRRSWGVSDAASRCGCGRWDDGRGWRWGKRNPVVAALLATVVLTLLLGAGVASFFALRATASEREAIRKAADEKQAREAATRAEERAQRKADDEKKARKAAVASARKATEAEQRGSVRLPMRRASGTEPRGCCTPARSAWPTASGRRATRPSLRMCSTARTGSGALGTPLSPHPLQPPRTADLSGHTGDVSSVCFSPDGKRLASASDDQTVKVWDAATGQEALTLKGHTSYVTSVCFSPDGKRLASASYDQTVKVWDAATGQEAFTLKGHTSSVNSVCFSPDGKRLISTDTKGSRIVWDLDTGKPLPGAPEQGIAGTQRSPDGQRFALSDGNVIRIHRLMAQRRRTGRGAPLGRTRFRLARRRSSCQ